MSLPTRRSAHRSLPFIPYLRRSPTGLVGLLLMLLVGMAALAAPLIAPHDPLAQDIMRRLTPPAWQTHDWTWPLGTDGLGRDLLSRILYGSRVSLLIGVSVVFISSAIGVLLGLIAGYYGKGIDMVIMRFTDVQLAMPATVLYLAIIAVFGPGLRNLVLALGLTGWVEYARLVYGLVLTIKGRQFIEAAGALGARDGRIVVRHLLPNLVSSIIVMSSLQLGRKILEAAGLSFLGLGVQPPTPDWGVMVAEGLESIERAWWVSTFPGLAILLLVLGTNTFGDWLRDYLDPQARRRR
jgi:peptide/nickel transport system permease protein